MFMQAEKEENETENDMNQGSIWGNHKGFSVA